MSHKHGAYLGGIRSIKCLKDRCRIVDDCWVWSGGLSNGRPAINMLIDGKRRAITGRRAALALSGVNLKPGQVAYRAEVCEQANCCNPAHSKVGTLADACRAAEKRDGWKLTPARAKKAAEFGRAKAKITADQAREIRESDEPRKVLADRYGICVSQVWNIRNGECWRTDGRDQAKNSSVFNWRPAA